MTVVESNVFWRLKGIAVFTIFFAHIPYQGGNIAMQYLYSYLGIVGVPIFLILSGFFEYSSKSSWKVKVKSLFYPLLFWATLGYLPEIIFGSFTSIGEILIGYLKWLYGCGTWLYFVPVLFWSKLLCKSYKTNILIFLTILSVVSITLTQFDLITYNEYFTKYTNPFNFLIYYIIGILLRKYGIDYKKRLYVLISIVLVGFVILFWRSLPSYFNIWCLPFSLSAFVLLNNLASVICFGEDIGKDSYVIYLSHMVPLGIMLKYINLFLGTSLQILNVPIAFTIITFTIWLFKRVLNILHMENISRIIGYRR